MKVILYCILILILLTQYEETNILNRKLNALEVKIQRLESQKEGERR